MVTSPGGYPSSAAWAPPGTAVEVEGTEQAAAAVAELAAAGASVIKVALDPTRGALTLPAPTLAAVVAAAAERRRGVRAFVAAGGRVVYGTDLGNQGPPPAVDVAELELLVEAGLSPVGAVAAATSHAAEHLGLRAIGSVAPGWVADLLLVDGDPLEDLRALTRVRLVSRAGWIAG